jgi:beta-lactamase class A
MRPSLFVLALLALAAPCAAIAQPTVPAAAPQPDPAFTARVQELPGVLQGTGNHAGFFSAHVLAQLTKERLAAVIAQIAASRGAPGAVLGIEPLTPWSAIVRLRFGAKDVARIELGVDPSAPHRVNTLLIRGFEVPEQSLDQVAATIRALPGKTGFAIAKLGSGAPQLLRQHNPDAPLAIGSAFKLVILAELIRATNAGERNWDDRITLDGSVLPAGGYRAKPAGTQVPLRELATQMISVSDNSATDVLLKALGREKVEAMMPVLGIADPARNRPFLSTMELFKLKGFAEGDFPGRYLAKDEAGKRAMLNGEIANALPIAIRPTLFIDGKPAMIETLEWFASPADLVRVMDWLRRHSEGPKGADARAILSKNPGIAPDSAGKWQWVGYKGGSEPGVLNLTLLLQARTGDWYALTAGWNDPTQAVDDTRLIGLITKAAELLVPVG